MIRELGVHLRVLIGFGPVLVERVWRTAIGSSSTWAWLPTAVPWVMASLVGAVVAVLSFLTLRVSAESPPLASIWLALAAALAVAIGQGALAPRSSAVLLRVTAIIVGGAVGGAVGALLATVLIDQALVAGLVAGLVCALAVLLRRLAIANTARSTTEALQPVPVLVSVLVVLAILPLVQAGAEIIVTRGTVSDFVDRRIGFSSTLIELPGYALLPPLPAEPPSDAKPAVLNRYSWLALRDDTHSQKVGLARTEISQAELAERDVLARVTTDAAGAAATSAELRARGYDPPATGSRVLAELTLENAAREGGGRSIGSVQDLDGLSDGTLVRIRLHFTGLAVATCLAGDSCDPHRLAGGVGPWDQVATDDDGRAAVIVRTPYPPSVAPVDLYGRQVSGSGIVDRLLGLPWVQPLLGWPQVLRAAILEHDPGLPVDRLWLGPALFLLLAALLVLGARIGYPVFRITDDEAPASSSPDPVRAVGSGSVTPPGSRPIEVERQTVELSLEDASPTLAVIGAQGRVHIAVPRAFGALSTVEVGELRRVRGRSPAIAASWYGSQLLLQFATHAERDRAAAILRQFRAGASS